MKEGRGRKWKEVIDEGIMAELEERESLGELNLIENNDFKYQPGMLILRREDEIQEIYYMDSTSEFYDEIIRKRLHKSEVNVSEK